MKATRMRLRLGRGAAVAGALCAAVAEPAKKASALQVRDRERKLRRCMIGSRSVPNPGALCAGPPWPFGQRGMNSCHAGERNGPRVDGGQGRNRTTDTRIFSE